MPKITREAIQKINNKCTNDWRLDLQYFLMHNEKRLIKVITIDDETYLQFILNYNDKNQVQLNISKYHKENEFCAVSHGLGKQKILNATPYTRKNILNLTEFTKTLNDEELKRINAMTEVTRTPIFVASENF